MDYVLPGRTGSVYPVVLVPCLPRRSKQGGPDRGRPRVSPLELRSAPPFRLVGIPRFRRGRRQAGRSDTHTGVVCSSVGGPGARREVVEVASHSLVEPFFCVRPGTDLVPKESVSTTPESYRSGPKASEGPSVRLGCRGPYVLGRSWGRRVGLVPSTDHGLLCQGTPGSTVCDSRNTGKTSTKKFKI